MKKFNKIFASATASLLCLSSLTTLSSNAVWLGHFQNNETSASEIESEYTLDSERIFPWNDNTNFYFSNSNSLLTIECNPKLFQITTDSSDDTEKIEEFLKLYYPDFEVEHTYYNSKTYMIYDNDALPFDGVMDSIEEAEAFYNALSEVVQIKSCDFKGGYVTPQSGFFYGYKYAVDAVGSDYIPDVLQNYIDEKGLDVEVSLSSHISSKYTTKCYLEPTREMTSQEIAQLYTNVYNDLGLRCEYFRYDSAIDGGSKSINLCKTDGDANTDNVLGIADATLILQYLTNKDEYDLTEQGAYNADLDKDGITALDAFAIQQMLIEQENNINSLL